MNIQKHFSSLFSLLRANPDCRRDEKGNKREKLFRKSNMKKLTVILLVSFSIQLNLFSTGNNALGNNPFVFHQGIFQANNIRTYFTNTGVFNKDFRYSNPLGMEWPIGSGKIALYSTGITTAAYVQGVLRMASVSYNGEYVPGYINNSSGVPIVITNSNFKIYNVRRTDIPDSNNWKNWGLMVPFGAPYVDVNHNGHYEYLIDTPGVKGADQTIFMCLTDGFPEEHKVGEGFGGGTAPLFAEVHMTAWGYNKTGLEDVIFIKWECINKNTQPWNGTFFSLVSNTTLGNLNDNYIGCDTIRKMSYCYNASNYDTVYGYNPPAVGLKWLECSSGNSLSKSYVYFKLWSNNVIPPCEGLGGDSNGYIMLAYNFMHGLKKDLTPWVVPPGGTTSLIIKACYSGDPETGAGWNEGQPGNPSGSVENCGGPNVLSGNIVNINPPGERHIVMNRGGTNFTMNPNDTQRIVLAQFVARGTSNLNSVTKLKQLADNVQQFCNNGFVIGVNNISSSLPESYVLYQNYPNPFNPSTKIRFLVPPSKGARGMMDIKLTIYDVIGKEITTLVNEQLKSGTYEIEWNASNFPSGVYFYKLMTSDFVQVKKMVLLK